MVLCTGKSPVGVIFGVRRGGRTLSPRRKMCGRLVRFADDELHRRDRGGLLGGGRRGLGGCGEVLEAFLVSVLVACVGGTPDAQRAECDRRKKDREEAGGTHGSKWVHVGSKPERAVKASAMDGEPEGKGVTAWVGSCWTNQIANRGSRLCAAASGLAFGRPVVLDSGEARSDGVLW